MQEEERWQTFSDVRCHRLFDMTNKDGDGRLAFKDLVGGCLLVGLPVLCCLWCPACVVLPVVSAACVVLLVCL